MKQVETRYVVVRKYDNFLWQGGNTEYFIPNMAAAKFYTTREIAEKQLRKTYWWNYELHKENYVIKEVAITYELKKSINTPWSQEITHNLSDNHISLKEANASKNCAYVIAWYMNGYKQAPCFWTKDHSGWGRLDSEDLWVGTYVDAVKIAEEIRGVSILTHDCAKDIVSHYEFL